MNYYISDLHFNDQAIFNKCERPFNSIEEMTAAIVSKWNKKVKQEDNVYILGDLGKDDDPSFLEIYKKLNGNLHLIVGNHDELLINEIKNSNLFLSIKYIDLIIDQNRKVCLCHYPLMDWMEFNRNGILIYGHIHNKTPKNGEAYDLIKKYYSNLPAYNAGVDVIGFEPRTLDELIILKEANKHESYIN